MCGVAMHQVPGHQLSGTAYWGTSNSCRLSAQSRTDTVQPTPQKGAFMEREHSNIDSGISDLEARAVDFYRVEGDNVIVRESHLNRLPLFIVLGVAVILGVSTLSFLSQAALDSVLRQGRFVIALCFGLPVLMMYSFIVYRIYNQKLVITPEYLINVVGTLTWRERSIRLDYSRIAEIEIDVTLFQRAFHLGDVRITPIATESDDLFVVRGVRHPRILKDILRLRTRESAERASQTEGQNERP